MYEIYKKAIQYYLSLHNNSKLTQDEYLKIISNYKEWFQPEFDYDSTFFIENYYFNCKDLYIILFLTFTHDDLLYIHYFNTFLNKNVISQLKLYNL